MELVQCVFCKHKILTVERIKKCAAYPDGIPQAILDMEVDHRKPYNGDNGITFEFDDFCTEKEKKNVTRLLNETFRPFLSWFYFILDIFNL